MVYTQMHRLCLEPEKMQYMEVGSHQEHMNPLCRSVYLNASIWSFLKVAQMCPSMLMISLNSALEAQQSV